MKMLNEACLRIWYAWIQVSHGGQGVLRPNFMPHSNSCGYRVARILRADGYDQRSEIDYRELNQDS
jgi:hypothetical protein